MLTDNATVYRHGTDWGQVCTAWQLKRRFTKPGCPWTTNILRTRGLDRFLTHYNNRRGHSALGGQPPISRLTAA